MKSPTTIVIIGLNLIGSIIFGIVTSYLFKGTNAFIVSLLYFIAITVVEIKFVSDKNGKFQAKSISLYEMLKPKDNLSEIVLLYSIKSLDNIKQNTITVGRDEIWNFWRDCVSRLQNSNFVMTHALPEETWNLGWHESALALQKERIQNGCKIERIFVVDKNENLNIYKESVKRQQDIGIQTSWIYKEDLLANELTNERYKTIQTLDFAIMDKTWLKRNFLDDRRRLMNGNLIKEQVLLDKAFFVFQEARKFSKVWNFD